MSERSITKPQPHPRSLDAWISRLRIMLAESRMLRGGRMLKWKGEVATCAPMMAQLVGAVQRGLGASCAALIVAGALTPATAANYTAANEAELRQAINNANADGDPASTITLTGNVALANPSLAFPALTKPLTINTGTFTLSAGDTAVGAGQTLSFSGNTLFTSGTFRGGNQTATNANLVGGAGITMTNGGVDNSAAVTGGNGSNNQGTNVTAGVGGAGMSLTNSSLINHSSLIGGAGGTTNNLGSASNTGTRGGAGGAGLVMSGGSLNNLGTITGGLGGSVINFAAVNDRFAGVGGSGASITGGTHANSGTITGGQGGIGANDISSGHGGGGVGVALAGGAVFTNNSAGTIAGGNGRAGGGGSAGSPGGTGVTVTSSTFENAGTVRGGHGGGTGSGAGLTGSNATVVNSGTISAGRASLGAGALGATAIQFTAGANRLEIWSTSIINGNVLGATAAGSSDTLALGGATSSSFAVSQIGGSAQYRNFNFFEKTGTSTWTLTGTTTEVTPWSLVQGTLSISSDGNLGAAAGTVTFNGGTLQTTAAFSSARTMTINAPGGTIQTLADLTVSSVIGGAGALNKTGGSALILTGTNTYSGGTTISEGTLQLGNGGTTGSIVGPIVDNGTLAINRSNNLTLSGAIIGTGNLVQMGTGTTILSGDNTYAGGTTISAGTLQLGNGGTSGSIVGPVLNNSILAFNRSDTLNYGGVVSGTGSVRQIGSGATVLTGANSYTGLTTVVGGTLIAANDFALGAATGGTNVATGATLGLTGGITLQEQAITLSGSGAGGNGALRNLSGNNTVLGAISLESSTRIQSDANTLTLSGGISGPNHNLTFAGPGNIVVDSAIATGTGSVTKEGSGTTTFSGASSYSGGTFLNGGVLSVSADENLGASGSALTFNGGTLQNTAAFTSSARPVTINAAGGTFQTDADLTWSGMIGGAGALTKTGSSALILTADNNYGGGTTISAGTLQLGAGGATGSITGNVVNNATLAFNRNNTLTFDGVISGTGSVNQIGSGTTILTADSTYTGQTFIAAGTLQLGNGGTTGSIASTLVTNNGILTFNRSDDVTFGALISGTGAINQIGSGVTVLNNNNSYTGATNVSAGTLLVNGDQSGATGPTSVLAGATLGGSGTIGGSVTVANGAHLAPGGLGNASGTLTIQQNLGLSGGSLLDFNFGQANAPGNPANDLVNVGGNVTLDGTLNVSLSPSGTFAPGLYRVMNYSGGLNNQGLDIGSVPPGVNPADVFVQTSVAGQVNLVNTAGLTLQFWDGAAGPKNDGVINGGIGVWQSNGFGANDNWTIVDGTPNAPFSNGSFAVFLGEANTVTVDSVTFGQVRAAGMQFGSDGYLIQGDPIQLDDPNAVGGSAVIRVDPGMTATVAAQLMGDVQLVKFDTGTLILSGNNSYTGGTRIESGTLQVSSNANLGDTAGGLTFAGGTLRNTAAFTSARAVALEGPGGTFETQADLTLTGGISGAGALTKTGNATLILNSDAMYTGGTTITAGTLQIGDGNTTGTITGPIVNNSVLAFNRAGVITVPGLISGTGVVNQIGTGTTIFTGDNTYTGLTTIAAGTLQLGDGGATGSIVGDVLNNSVLTFNRSGTLAMPGLISGTGTVNQSGPGVTILTGNNSYTGATNVIAGTLLVNGNQSAATGPTTVLSGATLGGSGTIGGSVSVANGGIIAPGGAVGNVPGTLTIQQNLALGGGSILDFNFGEANVVGGARNDHIAVGGNLTLDGTINVMQSSTPGSSFGAGIYRVITYNGSFTNNGLDLGIMPPGSDVTVQTTIPGQVNLINTAGLTLNVWDGDAGPKNNGVPDGGDGVWQNSNGNDNWTTVVGTPNAPFTDAAFAIFMGAPGTVRVDNSLGQVAVSGMQFATSGYRIQGDSILLTGATSEIRVGDGSPGDQGWIATIASELTGGAALLKTGAGTLILSGTNSYAGGTNIEAGTLQISADANLGLAGTAVTLNGGTLRTTESFTSNRPFDLVSTGTIFTDPGTTFSVSGTMSGAGGFTKDGDGTMSLLTAATYTGATTVANGTLRAGAANVFAPFSATTVQTGGTLDLNGFDQTLSSLTNAGLVQLNGAPGTTLTVTGNYAGNGGALAVNTELGGDSSPTDRLVATTTSGATTLQVNNVGGTGAATTNGIKVIDVTNPGGSTGTFTLQGDYVFKGQQAVVGGAYAYTLQQNGVSTTDGDWYLRSSLLNPPPDIPPSGPLLQPGVPLYETYGQALLGLVRMPTLQQRVGNRYWGGDDAASSSVPALAFASAGVPTSARDVLPDSNQPLLWTRAEGRHTKFNPTTTTGSRYDTNQFVVQSGLDGLLVDNNSGRLIAGVNGQYGNVAAAVRSIWGNGRIAIDGFSFGGALTWYGNDGFYADGQVQATWFDSKFTSSLVNGRVANDNEAFAHAFSVEGGKRFSFGGGWAVTPQAQLSYASVSANFDDRFGANVKLDDAKSLLGRVGLAIDNRNAWRDASGEVRRTSVYSIGNLYYEFFDGTVANVSGTTFANANERLWGGVGLGGTYNWANDRYALYGEVSINTSLKEFGDNYSLNGTAGFRIKW